MNNPVPSHDLEARLAAVRSMIRRTQRARAVFLIVTVALGGLLVAMAADFVLAPLPGAARWMIFVAWIAAVLFVSRRALAPLMRKMPLVRIARWLEERHPEMQERLSTVLETGSAASGASRELLDEIAKAAARDIGEIDPRGEVRAARRRRQWKAPALAAAGLLLIAFAAWPRQSARLLLRALAPFSDVGNAGATDFVIEPGNTELLEGDALRISFTVSGRAKHPQLWLDTASTGGTTQPVDEENGRFVFTIDPARETVRYQVRAGRSHSDTFTATVLPMPRLANLRADLEYPSYAELAKASIDPSKGIDALPGTKVTLGATANTPVESAWIELNGKRVAEGGYRSSSAGSRYVFNWLMETGSAGEAVVVLAHRLRPRIEALRFDVTVATDHAPEVVITSPEQRELRVRPDETIPLGHEIVEDFGLAEIAIDVEADKPSSIPQSQPERIGGTKPPRYRGTATVAVGSLIDSHPNAREFNIRITASDRRPANLDGPGRGHSEWIKLRVDSNAESLARQELKRDREAARSAIEEAIRDARDAKHEGNRAEHGMRQETPPKEALEQARKAAEKLARAEETASGLAGNLTESLHAAKSDDARSAAKELAEAREKIEDAPLQENPDERGDRMREADKQIERAISQLEKIRDAIERDRQLGEDVVALQELANRQNELAREAESQTGQTANNEDQSPQAPDKEWSEQQRQVANELRREVAERADAKAEALRNQAEKARNLAEAADALAEKQQALSEEARQLADENPTQSSPAPEAHAGNQREQAEAAAELAAQVAELPALESNGPADQAKQAADQAAKSAESAAAEMAKSTTPAEASEKSTGENQESDSTTGSSPGSGSPTPSEMAAAKAAAPMNRQSAERLARSAEALRQAAESFEQAAGAAAQQAAESQPPHGQAQAPAGELAAALEAASEAAGASDSEQAASQSAAAAEALSKAAAAAREAMKGGPPSRSNTPSLAQGARPSPPQGAGMDKPDAEYRQRGANPGLPPELARLGISAADWERIRASLSQDIGAAAGDEVPTEYRTLVRDYFQNLTKPPAGGGK